MRSCRQWTPLIIAAKLFSSLTGGKVDRCTEGQEELLAGASANGSPEGGGAP